MNLLKYILSAFLGWMAFCGVQAQKKIIFGSNDSIALPPFRESFQALAKNRTIYNQYNDSIFLIHDHDQWVNFFRRRALKNQQIYASNKVLLGNIFDYFKRDTTYTEAYIELLQSYFQDYRKTSSSDPFLTYKVCKTLEEYDEQAPDSMNLSNFMNLWLGEACMQIYNLGKDPENIKKSCQYYQRLTFDEARKYSGYDWAYPQALYVLLANSYLVNKCLTIQEHNEYFQKLKIWYDKHQGEKLFSLDTWRRFKNIILTHDESLLRNVYMMDSTIMEKQVADSLMTRLIERNEKNEHLTLLSLGRTLMMKVKLGQMTAGQAVDAYMDKYKLDLKTLKGKRLDAVMLNEYLVPFTNIFYLNDVSDRALSKKQSLVRRLCNDIEWAYLHRKDQQESTTYIKSLNTLTTYPRITKYLKPEERIRFLNVLNVATQVTTYAHSVHVSMIAEALMEGVLKYQPKLLLGTLGYLYVEDIVKNKKVFMDFAHNAAMYHDLGKNSIISVVNNDYRPLTDEEFAIIKRHPELGLQYLDLAPELAKFHDTTLGHHKWYNGKGGYPDSFDNTQSPMRILIDMVTLSDCMQAATERVGRNYKGDKTFDVVMSEFRRDAGVRYNPDLVAFIDKHTDVAEKLAALINDGWVEIYYDIYSQFFK